MSGCGLVTKISPIYITDIYSGANLRFAIVRRTILLQNAYVTVNGVNSNKHAIRFPDGDRPDPLYRFREDTMAKTLVLYDGRSSSAERVAVTLGCIIGKVRIRELGEAPKVLEGFRNVLFVCNFYGALTASRTRDYVSAHKDVLSERRIALVGVGFSDMGFVKYVGSLEAMLRLSEPLTTVFLRNEKMTVEVGAHLSKIFGAASRPLPPKALLESIQAFASAHSVMALATANEEYVRCTPVDYSYAEGKFYIVTEGGMKFRSILRNNHVSLAVFEGERHPDGLLDVLQVEGTVEVLPGDSPVAHREAAARIQRGGMDSGEIFVLCVTPHRYHISSAAFVAWGYDAEQTLDAEQIEALLREEAGLASANAAPEDSEAGAAAAYVGQALPDEPADADSAESAEDADFTDSLEQAEAYADASQAKAFEDEPETEVPVDEDALDEPVGEEDPGTLRDAEAAFALESLEEDPYADLQDGKASAEDEKQAAEAEEPKEDENAAPDLMLAEGVDWLNFSVGDFSEPKEEGEAPAEATVYGEDNENPEGFDEPVRPDDTGEGFQEGAAPQAEPWPTVGSEMEAAFADEDEESEIKVKEPFADAESLASRKLDPDEEELFGEEEEEKPKKRGFFANAKERFSNFRKKKAARETEEAAAQELPKTMLSAQRNLSRKDETGPSRYVYNADEDDDFFKDDEYDDEFDEYD